MLTRAHLGVAASVALLSCGPEYQELRLCDLVVVNEVFASADTAFLDRECGIVDWVELYNPTDDPIDLTGFGLTTNPELAGWPLRGRDVTLPAHGWLVVVMSPNEITGCDRPISGIDLNRDGTSVLLRAPGGAVCQKVDFPDQHSDFTWSRLEDGGDRCVRAAPTPGATNAGARPLSGHDFPCQPPDGDFGLWSHDPTRLGEVAVTCDPETDRLRVTARTLTGWIEQPAYAHLSAPGGRHELVYLTTTDAADDGTCDAIGGLTQDLRCADLPGLRAMVRVISENDCAGCAITPGDGGFFDRNIFGDPDWAAMNDFIGCPDPSQSAGCRSAVRLGGEPLPTCGAAP